MCELPASQWRLIITKQRLTETTQAAAQTRGRRILLAPLSPVKNRFLLYSSRFGINSGDEFSRECARLISRTESS